MFKIKFDFYCSGISDYCLYLYCYIHNVLTDMSYKELSQVYYIWFGLLFNGISTPYGLFNAEI